MVELDNDSQFLTHIDDGVFKQRVIHNFFVIGFKFNIESSNKHLEYSIAILEKSLKG